MSPYVSAVKSASTASNAVPVCTNVTQLGAVSGRFAHTLTAEDPLPPDLRATLALIRGPK